MLKKAERIEMLKQVNKLLYNETKTETLTKAQDIVEKMLAKDGVFVLKNWKGKQ